MKQIVVITYMLHVNVYKQTNEISFERSLGFESKFSRRCTPAAAAAAAVLLPLSLLPSLCYQPAAAAAVRLLACCRYHSPATASLLALPSWGAVA